MKNSIIYVLCSLFLTGLFAQPQLIEKVDRKPGEMIISYEKYHLDNGLTLLIHEDHSDPLVHVDVTYHVGSAREEINKSGFAHFFEHMMFQGSDNVADEQHFKIVTESGGTLNGTTNRDRTNYFETMPKNQLEIALWLEADRMGFLLDAVTQQKFEIQRATVKNERGQRIDNRPYGRINERMGQALYPYGHPYSWPVIGWIEDLNAVDVTDLKQFFMRWYGPNNATISVGGDVEPAEVVKLVDKYFGSIPRGPEVAKMPPQNANLKRTQYLSIEDKVKSPQLNITFPSSPMFHEDEAACDCLTNIIGGGKGSLLYEKLDKQKKALFSFAYNRTSELTGEISLGVRAFPNTPLSEIESIVRDVLSEIETRGISESDIAKCKGIYESYFIESMESVRGKVSYLAQYETFSGDPKNFKREFNRYMALTPASVMAAYNKYMKGKPSVVCSTVPDGQLDLVTQEDDVIVDKTSYEITAEDYSGLTYNKAKDNFDRSIQPPSGPSPFVPVPDYWTEKMPNGIKVIGVKNDEVPTVVIQLSIEGGHRIESQLQGKNGISSLTANLMGESTENYSMEEMTEELKKIGSEISFYAGQEETDIYVSCQVKHLDRTLELFQERLFKPKFSEEDFDRTMKKALQNVEEAKTRPASVAWDEYNKLIYGENHIMGKPARGTTQSLENITLKDVKAFYQKYYSPNVTKLIIVGDVDKELILSKLEFLNNWKSTDVKLPKATSLKEPSSSKIYLLDKPGAAQSEIRLGYPAMPFDATGNYYKAGLMNYNLGGAFNSRININLREDKGWTYGARSRFSGNKYDGIYTISAAVKKEATDSSLVEILKELNLYLNDGITEKDVEFLKSSIGQREALQYESSWEKSNFLERILTYNLDKTYTDTRKEILQKITREELMSFAKEYIRPDKMNMLIVGDKETILPGLQKLGIEIVELKMDTEKQPKEGGTKE